MEKEQAGEATGRREKWGEFRLSEVLVAQPCRPSQCFVTTAYESLECLKKHGYLYPTNCISCGARASHSPGTEGKSGAVPVQ